METIDVIHTSEVSGCSNSSVGAAVFCLGNGGVMKYARALATSIMMRMTKIRPEVEPGPSALSRQQDEGNQRDAGYAISLESVSGRPDRVARVVTRAIGDHARVASVVFLDLEDDFIRSAPMSQSW